MSRTRREAIRRLATAGLSAGMLSVLAVSHAAGSGRSGTPASCAPEQATRWRGGTLRLENDLLAGTDRNYTNGLALALVSRDFESAPSPACLPRPIGLYGRFLDLIEPGFRREEADTSMSQNVVVRLGQAIYTPEDGTRSDLIVDDRPYAGLLYFGIAWNRRIHPRDTGYEVLDVRDLTLGVIGPWSLAEQSQDLAHRAEGAARFRGWDHQLRNETALQLTRERRFRPFAGDTGVAGWRHDAIGGYALRVGNVETSASAGLELRAGWNLPDDFGSYPIRAGAENRPPSAVRKTHESKGMAPGARRPGVHAFVNLELSAIAHDFSLDGNLFHDSHRVSRRPLVAQVAAGISSQWFVAGRRLRFAVMRVWRTREFDEQSGDPAFGSIAFSWER